MIDDDAKTRRPWITLVAPLPAILVGSAIAAAHGVPWIAFAPNVIAAVLGVVLVVLSRHAGARAAVVMPTIAVLVMLATFVGPDLDGVHRWVSIGGLRLGASMAFAPWILLGLAAGSQRARTIAVALMLLAQMIHVVQPDAGQATTLAVGALPLVLDRRRFPTNLGVAVAFASIALAAAAWSMHDPLAPVDHVERVLVLGLALGPAWILAMGFAGATLVLPFVVRWRGDPAVASAAIGGLVTAFVVTLIGHFPVPVFGGGAGPVLGWYTLLAVVWRATPRGPAGAAPREAGDAPDRDRTAGATSARS